MRQMAMNDVATEQIRQSATRQLILLPLLAWLVVLPTSQAAAIYVYWNVAPVWMFLVPGLIFVAAMAGHWQVKKTYERDPATFSPATWRDVATCTYVAAFLAQGLLCALLASRPGDEQRLLCLISVCLMLSIVPSRWDGRLYTLGALALLAPIAAVLTFGGPYPLPVGLLAILCSFVTVFSVAAADARKRTADSQWPRRNGQ